MKEYIIKHKSDWKNIPYLDVSEILWLADANIKMSQQICFDDKAIYVHQIAEEKNIRKEEKEITAQVCNDSCMEFFFDLASDGRYFNIEINPLGNIYLGFGRERSKRFRILLKNPQEKFNIQTKETNTGWEAFYSIPIDFIKDFYPDFSPRTSPKIKANCYKCGDKTIVPHYMSWNPVLSEKPDFHRSQDFGIMIFEK